MSFRPLRRVLPALAPFVLLACNRSAAPPLAAAGNPAGAVTALADEYFAGLLERSPELATFWGLKDARHDGVIDASPEAFARWRDREDAWFARVSAIGAAGLEGTPAEVTLAILRESLESARSSRVCRPELWSVSQLFGWQVAYPRLGSIQPLGDSTARAQALSLPMSWWARIASWSCQPIV